MAGHSYWHSLRLCGCLPDVSSILHFHLVSYIRFFPDDSAAHISEETVGAARSAPVAILLGVAGTQILGWLLLIAASFATTSVADLLATDLPLPMGQLFLNVLGKKGMLAPWSMIIVVQVSLSPST